MIYLRRRGLLLTPWQLIAREWRWAVIWFRKPKPVLVWSGKMYVAPTAHLHEIQRLVNGGVPLELAIKMVDVYTATVRKAFEREIMEHGTGGSPLFKLLSRS